MSVFHTNILAGASGAGGAAAAAFQIDRSIRINSADSAYLNRTPSSASNRKTWTYSVWAKLQPATIGGYNLLWSCTPNGSSGDQDALYIDNTTDQMILIFNITDPGGSNLTVFQTERKFRDPSAWYHIVLRYDATAGSNYVKLYINGAEETAFVTDNRNNSNLSNHDAAWNSAGEHRIGKAHANSDRLNAYLAEVNFVDGTALAASDFGEYDSDNVWQPKDTSGLTFGTNGFRLDFSDNSSASALGNDAAGSNNWTVNNLSVASGAGNDSLIDSPMNYTATSGNNGGNYCVLNPLDISGSSTVSNGNLDCSVAAGATNVVSGNFHLTSGKWYWEVAITSSTTKVMVGVADGSQKPSNREWQFEGWYYYGNNGKKYHSSSAATYGSSFGQNDIIGVALDMDNGTLTFYKNGTSQGVAYNSGLSGLSIVPSVNNGGGTESHTVTFNFGSRPFVHTPPSNHLSICTQNLSAPSIADPSTAIDVALYTGATGTKTISGLNFEPDFVWVKSRSISSNHNLFDQVRGISSGRIFSNLTNAATGGGISSYTSDGWQYTTNLQNFNQNGVTYVGWSWDAGTSTVTNTDGTHSAQVRANSSTGFSISTHSRTTAGSISTWGHGLNAAPEFAMLKAYNGSYNWVVWHKDIGYRKRIFLNSSSAGNSYSFDIWSSNSTTLGVYGTIIAGGGTALDCVTYAWAPIEGYSKFGSYEGNGSNDGPFVFLGFRPRWIMIKSSTTTQHWYIHDSERDTHNSVENALRASLANATSTTSDRMDFLSNGFRITKSNLDMNESGQTFIYAAFAEHPFKTARAR